MLSEKASAHTQPAPLLHTQAACIRSAHTANAHTQAACIRSAHTASVHTQPVSHIASVHRQRTDTSMHT